MSGSRPRRLIPSDHFKETYAELLGRYYPPAGELHNRFLEFFREDLVRPLTANPRPSGARAEPWPNKTHNPEWEFWKLTFGMPGLTGAPAQGRLMYFVDLKSDVLLLWWIYTHEQFRGRPSEQLMKVKVRGLF